MLDPEHLFEFIETGVTVIEGVLNPDEIEEKRKSFHHQLKKYDVDYEGILSGKCLPSDGVRMKSCTSNMYYEKWKIDAQINGKIYGIWRDLVVKTFGRKIKYFDDHPFGYFDDVIPYIDKVCFRLPDHIREEGGLEMHIDRNPTDHYLLRNGGLKRWRPVQGFITLTDHFGSECGGLKCVKGFHKETNEYFAGQEFVGGGEFCRLVSKSHAKLSLRLEPINAPAGSLVMWDNRLPHSTCSKLISDDTREVIYMSYIPNVDINKKYIYDQLKHIISKIPPPMYYNSAGDRVSCCRDWEFSDLTEFQKLMLNFKS
jgi:hypothetical protein